VGWGAEPAGVPPTASATKDGPGFAGQTQALALQTSPAAAQPCSTCQERQADPATTGRQRWTESALGLHRVAPSCVQASAAGQAQATAPPDVVQVIPGSSQERVLRVEQTPLPAVQVTISPETQEVPGMHWPSVVWPGQESASTLQAPLLPQPWSDGQFRSDVQGAPVVVTVQAASRARNTGGTDRRIGGRLPEAVTRAACDGGDRPRRGPCGQMGRKETLY
jgi:hypothetical protein